MNKDEVLALSAKSCTKCGLFKQRSDFSIRVRDGRAYSHSECKECAKQNKAKWYANNIDYARAHARNHHWLNRDKILVKKSKFNNEHRKALNEEAHNRYWANPEVFRSRRREQHAKHRDKDNLELRYRRLKIYGLSHETYNAMQVAQDRVCAICKQPETRIVKNSVCNLSVDHNHQTGAVRSLLCSNCNLAVGFVKENLNIAESLVTYLRQWKDK